MKTWVVGGYSGKWDGILFIIDAETEEQAVAIVAKKVGLCHYYIDIGDEYRGYIMIEGELDMDDIKHSILYGDFPRRAYSIGVQELEKNVNLEDVASLI